MGYPVAVLGNRMAYRICCTFEKKSRRTMRVYQDPGFVRSCENSDTYRYKVNSIWDKEALTATGVTSPYVVDRPKLRSYRIPGKSSHFARLNAKTGTSDDKIKL